jgi:flavin reductase (DIM6/NTAB) family NADH-FMN oxidoreductase RutF
MIDGSEFRRVMGHFATGVAIVTARTADGSPCGLTVNEFSSGSLDPPRVLVCIERAALSHDHIQKAGAFVVNVLAEERGELLARRFSTWGVNEKFDGVAYRTELSGAPVLESALAWLECRVHEAVPAGDHTIFVGEVLDADAHEGRALVYYRGGYGRFSP